MSDTDIFENTEGVVERDALLFRAGAYPDKDIEVTEEDLDRMVAGFEPAPIKVEHTDTPLRFGVVTRIWRVGRELFGRLAFNPLAWALARECGATKLSVAVRRDKSGLREVSLVRSPRIADAAVFGREAEYFAGEDLDGAAASDEPTRGFGFKEQAEASQTAEGGDSMEAKSEDAGMAAALLPTDDGVDFAGRVAELEQRVRAKDADAMIEDFKRQGKLAPAAEALARSLLMAADDQVVTFADPATGSETKESVARTFAAFLGAQPKVIEFAELVVGSAATEGSGFSAEEERLFEKLGVDAKTVARHSKREAASG